MTEIMWEWDGPVEETLRPRGRKSRTEDDSERGTTGREKAGEGSTLWSAAATKRVKELNVAMSTFRTDSHASCPVRVTFILDSTSPDQANTETYQILKRKLKLPLDSGGRESFGEFGCFRHSGTIEKTQVHFDLFVKGPSLPAGKRNSLVMFFDEILPTQISRGETVEPDAVYVLDADSGHPRNGLQDLDSMWQLLMAEDETACITCPVRPVRPFGSFLGAAQFLEYALVWDNVGESHFALQTTCRGAQCMFKYRSLVEDGRLAQPPVGEGAMPPVLDSFSKTAAGIPALILLDTCPSEGLLVLLRQRDFDVRACGVVDGVTCAPRSWLEFYAQRRRWYAGSLVAVASHLTGKESYFQATFHRWIISSYAFLANLYLHCGVAFIPVLLAKGIYRIYDYTNSGGESDDTQRGKFDSTDTLQPVDLEWVIFGVIWAFLLTNVAVYLSWSQEQLWMWINWTSVLWMAFCLAALIGTGVVVSPYLPLAVVVIPMVLAGLNSSRGICANWFHFAFAAVPFVLVTTVNSVLVLLYALASLDSMEWGTREVGFFDSGVSKSRKVSMHRRKLCVLFTVTASSCLVGVLLMLFPSYTLFPVIVGFPVAAYSLKLLLIVLPAMLERSRQRAIIGDAGHRPLSLRRNVSEMASINGSDYLSGRRRGSSYNGGRSRTASGKGLTENSSQVTAEDGTPSPGDVDVATSGSFFAFQSGNSEGGDSLSGRLVSDKAGHRRQGSKSASISSGFAGVAGVGGGGIGSGSMNGATSTHSAGSRRSSKGSRTSGRAGSSRSRSRSRSPSEAPEKMSTGVASRSGAVSRAIASGVRAGVRRMNSRGESVRVGSSATARGVGVPPTGTRRTGFAQFLSKDSADEVDAGYTSPSTRPARKQKTKADIRKTWGLRQETMESEDNIQFETSEAFKHKPMPNGDRRGTAGVREPAPSSSQHAKTKSSATASAAPAEGGVKRYSWAQRRMSSADLDSAPQDQVAPRTPERGRDGIRSSLSRSSMGSEDDMVCPSPAAINAILNSRIGAHRRGDIVDEYANSVINRRRPAAGGTMAGIRAAWGTSMGGSQDDIMCPSPSAVNAVRNSRVKGSYARGIVDDEGSEAEPEYVDPRSLGPGVPGSRRRPIGDKFAGIRAAWGTSMGGSQDDIVCPSPSAINMVRNSRPAAKKSVPVKIQLDDDSDSEEEEAHSRSLGSGIVGSRRRPVASVGGNQDMICASPATVNAILNSRVGAVYSRGGDGGRPTSNTAARPPKIVSTPTRSSTRPRSERRASEAGSGSGSGSGRGSGNVGRGRGSGSGGVRGGGADEAAAARGDGRADTEAGRDGTARTRRRETTGSRGEAAGRRDNTAGKSRGESAGRSRGEVAGRSRGENAGRSRGESAGRSRGESAGRSRGESASKSRGESAGGSRGETARGHDRPSKGRDSARGGDKPRDQPRDQSAKGRNQPARSRGGETAGAGRGGAAAPVDAATARRRWSPGQSNVFDSSGSSSSDDEGKPRGLRGVRVLDAEVRGNGSTIRGGGAAAGSGTSAGGGGRRASGVGRAYRGPGGEVPTVGSSLAGVVTGGGGSAAARVPRHETLKGMPGFSRGLSGDGSEYSFEHGSRD